MQYLRNYIRAKEQYENDSVNEQRIRNLIAQRQHQPRPVQNKHGITETIGAIGIIIMMAIPIAIGLFILLFIISITPLRDSPLGNFVATLLLDFSLVDNHPLIGLPLVLYFWGLIISLAWSLRNSIKKTKKNRQQYQVALEKHTQGLTDIPQLKRDLQTASARTAQSKQKLIALEQKNIIHPDYFYYAGRLLEYLEKGRADTLKEALNLLEKERADHDREFAQEERDYEMRKRLASMEASQAAALADIQEEAERATDAAATAAGLSAASAYLSWRTAEEQRKQNE